jgi:hypothetical protein
LPDVSNIQVRMAGFCGTVGAPRREPQAAARWLERRELRPDPAGGLHPRSHDMTLAAGCSSPPGRIGEANAVAGCK